MIKKLIKEKNMCRNSNNSNSINRTGFHANITAIVIILIGSIFFNHTIAGIENRNIPEDVTNITNISHGYNYINWTWTDPNIDPKFLTLSIYIDGQYIGDVTAGLQHYNATHLAPGILHSIGIQTIDMRGRKYGTIKYSSSYTDPLKEISNGQTISNDQTPNATVTPILAPPIFPDHNIYYVAPNGNDDNPGTESLPFATIFRGISAASDGDTVKVLPGTYYPTYYTRPIVNKSISLIGSGRDTVIDGSKITQYSDGWQEGLVEIKRDGVYFGGFTIQNTITPDASNGAAGIVIMSDNNIVEKNFIQYTFDSGIKLYGSTNNWAYNNTIRYNELYRNVWGGDPNASNRQETLSISKADKFYIYYNYIHEMGLTPNGKVENGGEGIDAKDGVNNGSIHHNYIYKGMATGIYVDGYNNDATYMTVYDNIVERVARYAGQGYDSQGDGIDATSEQSGATNQININNNIVYNVGNGYAICDYHDPSTAAGVISNLVLNSNIAYIDDINITHNGDIQARDCGNKQSNILIKNNFAQKIYVDPNLSGEVTLYDNDVNPTDITNQFDNKYINLKSDILAHVNIFRFIVIGDTRNSTEKTAAESRSITRDGLNPNFIIFLGDLCPDTNCFATDWKYAINGDITGLTSNGMFNKTFATRGNHDPINVSNWQSAFDFAGVASSIGATNYAEQTKDMTYSFDYGNSHFVGLDVPGDVSIISPFQISWLDNDLETAESRGLTRAFLFWHGPIYYVDGHPSSPPYDLIDVLNKHPIISAAFFGHEHVVAYTHINDSRISTIAHPFEEFVSGGAGADLYDINLSRVDYCIGENVSACPKIYGYMSVDVSDRYFNVSFYNMNGTLDNILAFKK